MKTEVVVAVTKLEESPQALLDFLSKIKQADESVRLKVISSTPLSITISNYKISNKVNGDQLLVAKVEKLFIPNQDLASVEIIGGVPKSIATSSNELIF